MNNLRKAHQKALAAYQTNPSALSLTNRSSDVSNASVHHSTQLHHFQTRGTHPQRQELTQIYLNELRKAYKRCLLDHEKQGLGKIKRNQPKSQQQQKMLPPPRRKRKIDTLVLQDTPSLYSSVLHIYKTHERRDSYANTFFVNKEMTCNISNEDADMILQILA